MNSLTSCPVISVGRTVSDILPSARVSKLSTNTKSPGMHRMSRLLWLSPGHEPPQYQQYYDAPDSRDDVHPTPPAHARSGALTDQMNPDARPGVTTTLYDFGGYALGLSPISRMRY